MEVAERDGGEALAERLLNFAAAVLEIVGQLPRTEVGIHIGRQLLRSGTAPGANYEEARGAESRADFCHKLGIALKEAKESRFWLRLIVRANLLPENSVAPCLDEAEQLCAIMAKSILTARSRKP
jgi:four helix bundle protein